MDLDSGYLSRLLRSLEAEGLVEVTPSEGDRRVRTARLTDKGSGERELKRMWVAPSARGLGVGRRLLAELESRPAAAGAGTVRLETSGALVEAIAMHRSAGYREVGAFNDEPYAHHWFEKRLSTGRS